VNPRGGDHHVERRTPWKGYFQPQSKSILHRQSRVRQPSRAQIADFRHQTKPESLTNWSLEEYQGIALRLIQFLAILLTALVLVPSGAHLAALPNKMAMAQAAYFVAQQIYAGWALFGTVLFGALVANLAHTIVLRKPGRS
jgi:hypothetical protein